MQTAALFTFYNAFDDVTITLDNDTPHPEGPYTVAIKFEAPEIGGEDESFVFAKLADAVAKFNELQANEIFSILADGSFK